MNAGGRPGKFVRLNCPGKQKGSVLVITAILMVALLGMAALAVDLGYVAVSRSELQNAADAAALAGAGELGKIYEPKTPPLSLNADETNQIIAVAIEVGQKNKAAGKTPNIVTSDIVVGFWDSATNTFANAPPSGRIPNAVRAVARAAGGGSTPLGSVTTFFANIFGKSSVTVSAAATASLSAPCEEADLSIVAISSESPYCNEDPDIVFTANDPNKPPCGSWHSFDMVANTNNLRDLLNTYLNSQPACPAECGNNSATDTPIPGKEAGDTVNAINGLSSSLWECFQNLYTCRRDPSSLIWTIIVPVIDRPCGIMNQVPDIVSFATVYIKGVSIGSGGNVIVEGAPCGSSPCIKASVVCDNVVPGKGEGCMFFGTYGMIPGLVDKTPPAS